MGLSAIKIQGGDTSYNSGGAGNVFQVTTEGAKLFSVVGYSNLGAVQYIQLWDLASYASVSGAPLICVAVAADSHFWLEFPTGRQFTNGILVANSTTAITHTVGAADCLLDVSYRKD